MSESEERPTPQATTAAPEIPQPDSAAKAPQATHRIRWLSLCISASALVATLVLLVELRQGLPLSFGGTVLLAALASLVLPLLVMLGAGQRLRGYGIGRPQVWCLTCVFASAGLGLGLLI